MMEKLPAYFISHGAPNLALRDTPASRFLKSLDHETAKAKAILVISAHWMTEEPMVTAHPQPETIHDFAGFAPELYALRYPSPGDALLAAETVTQLNPAFPLARLDPKRGLDHGAWVPLLLAAPQAQIPVLQLSIQPHRDGHYHYEVGKRLADLREQGVMIIASGSATHNIQALFSRRYQQTPAEVSQFTDWLHHSVTERQDQALKEWEKAPFALWNHPSNDHILPLHTVLGATAGEKSAERIHHSYDYAVMAMDAYRL